MGSCVAEVPCASPSHHSRSTKIVSSTQFGIDRRSHLPELQLIKLKPYSAVSLSLQFCPQATILNWTLGWYSRSIDILATLSEEKTKFNTETQFNERKSLLRRSHAVLPSHIQNQNQLDSAHHPTMGGGGGGGHQPSMGGSSAKYGGGHQPTMGGGHQPSMGGSSTNYGGAINRLWGGGPSAKYGGLINQLWGGHQPTMGGHQPTMGGPSAKYGGDHQPTMGGASTNYGGVFSHQYVQEVKIHRITLATHTSCRL